MEAVILAGGKGTRLRPYTTTLPKPLMPVGERPILAIVIAQLKAAGIKKITIAVNHMAELIMAYFGNGEKFGVEITYSMEDKPLGTVGPVKLIKDLPDHFLVMNGDILCNLNYAELFKAHVASGAGFTIATYQRDAKIDFGVLEIDKTSKQLTAFIEKPTYHFDVSMGIYVFSKSVLEIVPRDQPFGIDNLALRMLAERQAVNTFPFSGYWLDIGRPDDYDQANNDVANNPGLFEKMDK
jgi:NDP-sugar pyrophosphorylase family protein